MKPIKVYIVVSNTGVVLDVFTRLEYAEMSLNEWNNTKYVRESFDKLYLRQSLVDIDTERFDCPSLF